MATVIRSNALIGNHADTRTEMQSLINNYWGTSTQERTFPIPMWQLNQLFNASTARQVALKARNISNPSLVNAEWIVFEEGMDTVLTDTRPRDEFYFVFNESDFDAIKSGALDTMESLNNVFFLGRIGKTLDTNEFTAFIFVAEFSLVTNGSTSFPGASAGVRIPPQ